MVNPVKKYAIIINGDGIEKRHLDNVDQAVAVLKEQWYETFVASPKHPVPGVSSYAAATRAGVEDLIKGLRAKIDGNDELVIYTTGHGGPQGGACLALQDGCFGAEVATPLDGLPHGKRTVVMDQCFSGNWAGRFTADPKTLFISDGSENKSVCCTEFAPFFWDDNVPDKNGDKVISWLERYAFAIPHILSSKPQYVSTTDYDDPGAKIDSGLKTNPDIEATRIVDGIISGSVATKEALETLAKLIDLIHNDTFLHYEAKLRTAFQSETNTKRKTLLLSAYAVFAPLLQTEEADRAYKALSDPLGDADGNVRAMATRVLIKIAGQFFVNGSVATLSVLRRLLADKNVDVRKAIMGESAKDFVSFRKLVFMLATNVTAEKAATEAVTTRLTFTYNIDGYSSLGQATIYMFFSDHLSDAGKADEAMALLKTIKTKLNDPSVSWEVHACILSISNLFGSMTNEGIREAAITLSGLVGAKSKYVRVAMLHAYNRMVPRLNKVMAEQISEYVKPLLEDPFKGVREGAEQLLKTLEAR